MKRQLLVMFWIISVILPFYLFYKKFINWGRGFQICFQEEIYAVICYVKLHQGLKYVHLRVSLFYLYCKPIEFIDNIYLNIRQKGEVMIREIVYIEQSVIQESMIK